MLGQSLSKASSITIMERSNLIEFEYSKESLLALLAFGAEPKDSPYSHKQIAEWCEQFWNKYSETDAPEEIENIMSVLADVETQWDLYLANTYSLNELRSLDFESVTMPIEWFKGWMVQVNA